MMDVPLTTWLLFEGAGTHHRHAEVVSRHPDGTVHRYTYGDFSARTKQLMNALDALGVPPGAVVATLAWNSYRHLEAYFAVPCSGRVLHAQYPPVPGRAGVRHARRGERRRASGPGLPAACGAGRA